MGKKSLLLISPFCYHIFPAFFHPCCHFKAFAVKHPDAIPALTKAGKILLSGRQQITPVASPSSFEQQKKQPHQLLQNFHLLSQHIVKVCLLSDRIHHFRIPVHHQWFTVSSSRSRAFSKAPIPLKKEDNRMSSNRYGIAIYSSRKM